MASAILPGMQVMAQGYRDYMWIATWGDPHETVVDGAPPGKNGRVYGTYEKGKAVKVPYEAGRFLIEHCGYTGVVRVEEIEREDGTGTDLNLSKAKEESLLKWQEGDEARWQQYMGYVMWKLEKKELVPPPPDTIKALMKRRGYVLADYGIHVTGQAGQLSSNNEIELLRKQNTELKAQGEQLMATVKALADKLADALGENDTDKKKK